MKVTFVTPGAPVPIGGVAMMYRFASSLVGRGHDVHLVHVDLHYGNVASLDDIPWYSFPPEITHHFLPPLHFDQGVLPEADVLFGYSVEWGLDPAAGLPVVLVQGYGIFRPSVEADAFHAPCPKVCVASWLLDVGREQFGVPADELVHVPLGLDHAKYRTTRPIEDRPLQVASCYNPSSSKSAMVAARAMVRAKNAEPDTRLVTFTSIPPVDRLPLRVEVRVDPPQDELVDDIYNGSRVFVNGARLEGFGLPAIEAMACGCALVTTDNGGSRDYAIHGETALVSPPGDAAALGEHVIELLRDDERRIALARAGAEHVRQFTWQRTGDRLERFLLDYLADPAAYGWTGVVA